MDQSLNKKPNKQIKITTMKSQNIHFKNTLVK